MRVNISPGIRNALITIAALEIFFAVGSIGLCITNLVYAMYDYGNPYDCYYDVYDVQYTSLVSQALWAGLFIIISACCKIRFATAPSKPTEQYSTGFAILAFIMAIAFTCFEGVAAFLYWKGWILDVTNFCVGLTLFILTLTTMILSSIAVGGRCNTRPNRTVPLGVTQMPLAYGSPQAYNGQAFVGHATSIAGQQLPGIAMQNYPPMGNRQQNFGAAAVLQQNIAYNATSQHQLNNQLPPSSYPRQNTVMRPQTQQTQVYPHLRTNDDQRSNAYMAVMQPISSTNPIQNDQGYQWQSSSPQDQPNTINQVSTAEQSQTFHRGGDYAAADYHVQEPGMKEQHATDVHQGPLRE